MARCSIWHTSLFKRFIFLDARIVTLTEGEIGHLHIGLTSTMNALHLTGLADKTVVGCTGVSSGEI